MIPSTCYYCDSTQIVHDGRTSNGKQRFVCRKCGRCSRADRASNGYPPERQAEILRAYHERTSLRGLTRVFGVTPHRLGVSRHTVTAWLKKSVEPATLGADLGQGKRIRKEEVEGELKVE
jgi:transposase-like protein